ncbi:MAG: acetyl-CoA carboxylase biotin carboxyl carrier protein [Planctomycetaceae bacterium]
MAKEPNPAEGPFDLDKVRALVELMAEHDLREISLRRGDERWRLRRGPQEVVQMVANSGALPAAVSSGATQPPPTPPPAPAASDVESVPGVFIKSPTVGTFYASPSPEDPAFVKIGARVSPDTVVCIVEAMKVFNQIPAEVSGTIAEILVNNGDPVEFGQPLFRVTPG